MRRRHIRIIRISPSASAIGFLLAGLCCSLVLLRLEGANNAAVGAHEVNAGVGMLMIRLAETILTKTMMRR